MSNLPNGDDFVREVGKQADRRREGRGKASGRGLAQVGTVGWMVALPAVGGAFLGRWIDTPVRNGHLLDALASDRRSGDWLRGGVAGNEPGVARMNWAAAAGTGFGLGLAYFGGLWLSVRGLRIGRV